MFLPNCESPFDTQDEEDLDEMYEEAITSAPTMAPVRTIVEAEVALSMDKDVWEESGEKAFKSSIAGSVGCLEEEVVVTNVVEVEALRRRKLGETALEVEFTIDVTRVVEEQAQMQVEEAEAEGEEIASPIADLEAAVVMDLVSVVSASLKSEELVTEMEEATGQEIEVVVVSEPKDEVVVLTTVVDPIEAKKLADTHEQGSGFAHFYDCYADTAGGVTRCAPVYIPVGMLFLALACCGVTCICACSSDEKRRRAHNRHMKAKSTRNLELELPRTSRGSSMDGQNFAGVNPMRGAAAPPPPGGGSADPKPKSNWIELVDEASGRQYFENLVSGETAWEPPREGYRNRLSLLAEKKRNAAGY